MVYEVAESKDMPGTWRVEAINHESEGQIYGAIFFGPQSEERARHYAAKMNAGEELYRHLLKDAATDSA